MAAEETEEFIGAIIFCPICCTNQDVDEPGWIEVECPSCGTEFHVDIKPEVVAAHAMTG